MGVGISSDSFFVCNITIKIITFDEIKWFWRRRIAMKIVIGFSNIKYLF